MLIRSMEEVLSQYISLHHIVYFKHITILFANYTSMKLG